jgi:hypothetical protein
MKKQISNTVLMTGAGYTNNFGGILAKDMRDKIRYHPEVKNKPALKELLDNNFDYESVYYEVYNGGYLDNEKEAIHTAIREAYKKLDEIAQKYNSRDPSKSEILYGASRIIDYMTRDMRKINFFFTLNQDLFIERLISCKYKNITRPPFPGRIFIPNTPESRLPLKNNDFVNVPTGDKLDTIKHATDFSPLECHYIKIHGSFGWKSSDPDRPDMMVIGRNKEEQIADELLLTRYLNLFEQVLLEGGIKLLIIGYGFRDDHINKVIAKAIESCDLELYIMSPSESEEFKNELIKADHVYGEYIFKNLSYYCKARFGDLFPPDGSDTLEWRELYDLFFAD